MRFIGKQWYYCLLKPVRYWCVQCNGNSQSWPPLCQTWCILHNSISVQRNNLFNNWCVKWGEGKHSANMLSLRLFSLPPYIEKHAFIVLHALTCHWNAYGYGVSAQPMPTLIFFICDYTLESFYGDFISFCAFIIALFSSVQNTVGLKSLGILQPIIIFFMYKPFHLQCNALGSFLSLGVYLFITLQQCPSTWNARWKAS